MHEKIINSVSLLTGNLEIIGDPVYLVTGGIGNYNPKQKNATVTEDGEVAHLRGQVLIAINFRNPIDINSFENGGMMRFDSNRVPFSGIYMVKSANSTFRNGSFTQRLDIIRVPGQLIDVNLQPSDPADVLTLKPNPVDSKLADTSIAIPQGERVSSSDLEDVFDRGAPSPGLPGQQVNFTGNFGGLGVNDSTLRNQSVGAFNLNSKLTSGSSPLGLPLLQDISTNLRLNSSGLAFLSQQSLENASKVKNTIDILGKSLTKTDAKNLASDLTAGFNQSLTQIPNKGSGIGIGASFQLAQEEFSLESNAISLTNGLSNDLTSNKVNQALGFNNKLSNNLIGQIGTKAQGLLGSVSDPLGKAARAGFDPSLLAGVGNFKSKSLNSLDKFNQVEGNINLQQAQADGILINQVSAGSLTNLPPSQPYTVAPEPGVNSSFVNNLVAAGGVRSLANAYGVNGINRISENLLPKNIKNAALENLSPGQFNPLQNLRSNVSLSDVAVNRDKNLSAQKMLYGNTYIRDNTQNVSAGSVFGSKSLAGSPLTRLMNNVGDAEAPAYTGSNPAIRKNLGMPPLPENS